MSGLRTRYYLTNSVASHLPDITIITPVFSPSSPSEIIFFTASRGHHADIGGILPGSMPPTSVNIFEEGAEIISLKIVDGGVFQRDRLYEYMVDSPAKYPGSSGCRNFKDVESDLKAVGLTSSVSPCLCSSRSRQQIAANHKGIGLLHACEFLLLRTLAPTTNEPLHAVVEEYSLEQVQEYMLHIRKNAELSVRNLLREVAKRLDTTELSAVDYLDDGTPVRVSSTLLLHPLM